MKGRDDAIFEFCAAIVDATADLACAFKPQIAYFAARRAEDQLEALIAHIHEKHPGIPVILDAKRGDIGSTAEQYAVEAFERFKADAVTVNPYMGRDSAAIPTWLTRTRASSCSAGRRTPGVPTSSSSTLATVKSSTSASPAWSRPNLEHERPDAALVVGATFPAEIARVREIVGDMPLLVPGIGAQGGDIEATVQGRPHSQCGTGLMINSSRAILYAGKDTSTSPQPPARWPKKRATRSTATVNRSRSWNST